MVVISKTNLSSSIWSNFRDTIYTDVFGTTVTDSHSVAHTVRRITNAFPDTQIDEASTYPIIVVSSPNLSTDIFTMGKTQVEGTIDIDIYANGSEAAEKFMDKILDSIETSKGDLADNNIHSVQLDSIDSDNVTRGQIKIHVRRATFRFVTRYTKTRGH